ncbi:MAG: hypothetical protein GY830_02245 [Bacteroidetes bacterium]|nr:hypothetical protein [Bacteroidota bacterium]
MDNNKDQSQNKSVIPKQAKREIPKKEIKKLDTKTINTFHKTKAFAMQYAGLAFYFFVFHLFNWIFFYIFWTKPMMILKLFYFAILFLFFKIFYLPIGMWFLKKYIAASELIQLFKARQQFILFTIFYGISYIGASTESSQDPIFISYVSICFVSHLIVLIIVHRKYRKAFKQSEFYEEFNKHKK